MSHFWGIQGEKGKRFWVRVRVFFHDKCFDGAACASLFARFYRERIRGDAEFVFSGLVHRAGSLFDESKFDGDENAIVDFKYSTSPRITWWFDHHQSAFLTPEDAAHFEQQQSQHQVLRSRLQELHQVPGHGGGAALWLSPRAGGGTDRVGGHHRRRAVSRRAQRGGDARARHAARPWSSKPRRTRASCRA